MKTLPSNISSCCLVYNKNEMNKKKRNNNNNNVDWTENMYSFWRGNKTLVFFPLYDIQCILLVHLQRHVFNCTQRGSFLRSLLSIHTHAYTNSHIHNAHTGVCVFAFVLFFLLFAVSLASSCSCWLCAVCAMVGAAYIRSAGFGSKIIQGSPAIE